MLQILSFILILSASTEPAPGARWTVEDCVNAALLKSGVVGEKSASAKIYEARLQQVESIYYPKLSAVGFIAPMFTVTGNATHYERRWKSISDWGPYTSLQALLVWPIYSFGRLEAGKDAAKKRLEVERARVRETENAVALEIRKFYAMRLFALSVMPALDQAADIIKTARERGQKLYDDSTGEVSQADLMKLEYGANEIARYRLMAEFGANLASSALKHTMGMDEDAQIEFADARLAPIEGADQKSLVEYIAQSVQQRPEWQQVESGTIAAEQWERAEKLANAPIIAVAGQLQASWAPTRQDSPNPYVFDPFNNVVGGVALALKWDLDPALAASKAAEAHATREQVESLAKYASTGIPLQVRKAYEDMAQHRQAFELNRDSVEATRKWMTFAAAAYGTGAGEARDLLEGLVAYLQSKRTYYESLQNYYIARAELDFAVGVGKRDLTDPGKLEKQDP
jgi:outer membrane protein TolC